MSDILHARLAQTATADGLRLSGVAAQTGSQVTGAKVHRGAEKLDAITFEADAFSAFLASGESAPLVYNHKRYLPPIAPATELAMDGKNLTFTAELSDTPHNQALVEMVLSGELSGASVGIKSEAGQFKVFDNGTALVHSTKITDITITEKGANPNAFVEAHLALEAALSSADKDTLTKINEEVLKSFLTEVLSLHDGGRTSGTGNADEDRERRLALVKDWRRKIAREV